MKRGILLAAFGSGSRQGESTLRFFEGLVRDRFPETPVRWAFTSTMMRRRLAGVRKKTDSVDKALRKMAFERFDRIAVQPLHVVCGHEYLEVLEQVKAVCADRAELCVSVGRPLLDRMEEMPAVTEALFRIVPPERRAEDAVLLIGHGSRLASDDPYGILARAARAEDPAVLLGTLSAGLDMEQFLSEFTALGTRRIWMVPLLAVVGRHVLEDVAGSGEHSWKSRLEKAGFVCFPVLRGLVETPGFARLWLERLEAACRKVFVEA